MKVYCKICGVLCEEKEKIEARKGVYYNVCTYCFNRYEFTSLNKIRKLIQNRKV